MHLVNSPSLSFNDCVQFDHYVPLEYEAEHCGFYINKGDLMFRQVRESDDETRHEGGGERYVCFKHYK